MDRIEPSTPTASGALWYPLDPRPEDFAIDDIAHHLSREYRYGGAVDITVAEHSVLVSQFVAPEFALEALLHDAGEAVVSDMVYQLKRRSEMHEFRRLERLNLEAILQRFGVMSTPRSQREIKEVDERIIVDECLALMTGGDQYLARKGVTWLPLGANVEGMSPELAKVSFLLRFEELRQ